jgi:hypothetical protein
MVPMDALGDASVLVREKVRSRLRVQLEYPRGIDDHLEVHKVLVYTKMRT